MLSKTQWWIIGGVGALVIAIVTILVIKGKKTNMNTKDDNNNDADKNVDKTKNYIIGDSQTPIIDRNSTKASLINKTGSEQSLWKGGEGLGWLKSAVKNYKVSTDVNITISFTLFSSSIFLIFSINFCTNAVGTPKLELIANLRFLFGFFSLII